MILGKIKVLIAHQGGTKYFFCRPLANSNNENHPRITGICHVVYVEKCLLNEHLEIDNEFECFGIFDKINTIEEFRRGYTHLKVSPITEAVYNQLIESYPQKEHAFQ